MSDFAKDTNVPTNDLISRQAAIDAVFNLDVSNRVSWKDAVIDTIDALPPAQAEIIACGQGELVQDGSRLVQDTISRQAALDALTEYWQGISDRHPTLDGEMAVYADCKGIIKRLTSAQQSMTATSNTETSDTVKIPVFDGTTERVPSVQPNLQPTCNQLATDCINRKAAIDAIRPLQTYKLSEGDEMLLVDKAEVQTELMMLPSVQPEPEHTMEEFMYGQDLGSPEDGSL